MFGIFKKKNYTKELLGLLTMQNDLMKSLLHRNKEKSKPELERSRKEDKGDFFENLYGEWLCEEIGIVINIRQGESGHYVNVQDLDDGQSYYNNEVILKKYRAISYFTVGNEPIFIEYDEEKDKIYLQGNLSLSRVQTAEEIENKQSL